MPSKDYTQSKIYKICSDSDDRFYIGSTNISLKNRLAWHKTHCGLSPSGFHKYITENGGWKEWKIELVEECNVEDNVELRKIEQGHLDEYNDDLLLLNVRRAYISEEQKAEEKRILGRERYQRKGGEIREKEKKYRIENKEWTLAYAKKYRVNNIESIAMRQKEYREKNTEQLQEYERNRNSTENRKEQHKKSRDNCKEKITERRAVKIRCEVCNCEVTKVHFKRHEQSKTHQRNLLKDKDI